MPSDPSLRRSDLSIAPRFPVTRNSESDLSARYARVGNRGAGNSYGVPALSATGVLSRGHSYGVWDPISNQQNHTLHIQSLSEYQIPSALSAARHSFEDGRRAHAAQLVTASSCRYSTNEYA